MKRKPAGYIEFRIASRKIAQGADKCSGFIGLDATIKGNRNNPLVKQFLKHSILKVVANG